MKDVVRREERKARKNRKNGGLPYSCPPALTTGRE